MRLLRILPVALALFASQAAPVIPSVVEGPGRVVARVSFYRAPKAVEYRQPRLVHETSHVIALPLSNATILIPLRGASTPRAPAA